MAGIYVHIPFCRKFCSYCDFYREKTLNDMPDYLEALEEEISLRQDYLDGEIIESLYFGGGTPSLLNPVQINRIVAALLKHHKFAEGCEITLEANPDDLSGVYMKQLKDLTPVNRLSIGIQSFSADDLKLLNRRHDERQSFSCIGDAIAAGFENISIDLIYGLPGMMLPAWQINLEHAFGYGIRHISAYHLTLEPGTVLHRKAEEGNLKMPEEEESHAQYMMLCELARKEGYVHYEISNLCRAGYEAIHNTGYWKQKKYLGLGPSAHSYNLISRQWNISDTGSYIRGMRLKRPVCSMEPMDMIKRFTENLMLLLRTNGGVSMENLRQEFGETAAGRFRKAAAGFIASGHMVRSGSQYKLTEEAWFISDHIISRLLD